MKTGMRLQGSSGESGAAAVEFALILPLLLLLIFGIIDFGRAYMAQISLTQAAREGARLSALGMSATDVTTRAEEAAIPITPVTVARTPCPATLTATSRTTVTVTHAFTFITPFGAIGDAFFGGGAGGPLTIEGTGVMRCGA